MRDHDELLRRYLLGRLETEERALLEERLLREEGLLEQAEAAEADLLDDYAHDRLAPEEREQVAHRLASSPRGRARLALIQGLGTIANERSGRLLSFPSARRELSRFERAAALAAMLTLAVLSVWLATRTPDFVNPPQVAETPAPASAAPLPAQRPVPPVATPAPTPVVIAESTPPETTPVPRADARPLVLQLALTTLRGEGEIPVRNVPPGTERVQLHLLLDEGDRNYYASFRATVRGAAPELRAEGLEPRNIDGRWTLVLDLDPDLPAGMYEVEVSGVTAAGDVEPITTAPGKELEIQRNASAGAGTPE